MRVTLFLLSLFAVSALAHHANSTQTVKHHSQEKSVVVEVTESTPVPSDTTVVVSEEKSE